MNDQEWTAFLDSLSREHRKVAQSVLARLEYVLERFRSQTLTEQQAQARRSDGNAARIVQAQTDIGRVSDRVHRMEDHIADLIELAHQLAVDVGRLKEKADDLGQ